MGDRFSINLIRAEEVIDALSEAVYDASYINSKLEEVQRTLESYGNLQRYRWPLKSIMEELAWEKNGICAMKMVLQKALLDYQSSEKRIAELSVNSLELINLQDIFMKIVGDSSAFIASFIHLSSGVSALDILGIEYSDEINAIFGNTTIAAFLAKYITEGSEEYFGKLSASDKTSLKSSGKFHNINDTIEDRLKKKGYLDKEEETAYYDKNGNKIAKEDAPEFYKKQLTVAEWKKSESISAALYDGQFDIGDKGEISFVLGEAEAHASFAAGLYVLGADGEKLFSPGVNAEVGASVTALEANWEQQWLGNEMLGLNSEVTATAGKAEAKANIGAQILGENGKLDVQLGASASAELIGGELEGSFGANVLGGEVGVSGSVNYGIGAHADVGYRDGVFKCDVGASLGVGVSFGVEVDIGGMVNTVVDTASAAWDDLVDMGNGIADVLDDIWPW